MQGNPKKTKNNWIGYVIAYLLGAGMILAIGLSGLFR